MAQRPPSNRNYNGGRGGGMRGGGPRHQHNDVQWAQNVPGPNAHIAMQYQSVEARGNPVLQLPATAQIVNDGPRGSVAQYTIVQPPQSTYMTPVMGFPGQYMMQPQTMYQQPPPNIHGQIPAQFQQPMPQVQPTANFSYSSHQPINAGAPVYVSTQQPQPVPQGSFQGPQGELAFPAGQHMVASQPITPRYNNDPVTTYGTVANEQSAGGASGQSTLTRREKKPLLIVDPSTHVCPPSVEHRAQEAIIPPPLTPKSEAESRPATVEPTEPPPTRSHTTSICSEVAPEERAPLPAVQHKPLLLQDPATGEAVKLPEHPVPSNPHPPQQQSVRPPFNPQLVTAYSGPPHVSPHVVPMHVMSLPPQVVPNGIAHEMPTTGTSPNALHVGIQETSAETVDTLTPKSKSQQEFFSLVTSSATEMAASTVPSFPSVPMPVVSQGVVFEDQAEQDTAHNISVSFGTSPITTPTVECAKEMPSVAVAKSASPAPITSSPVPTPPAPVVECEPSVVVTTPDTPPTSETPTLVDEEGVQDMSTVTVDDAFEQESAPGEGALLQKSLDKMLEAHAKFPNMYNPSTDLGNKSYPIEFMKIVHDSILLLKQPLITSVKRDGLKEVLLSGNAGNRFDHSAHMGQRTSVSQNDQFRTQWMTGPNRRGPQGGGGGRHGGGSIGGRPSQDGNRGGPRGSQHGGMGGGGGGQGGGGGRPGMTIQRSSIRDTPALNKAEDAWKAGLKDEGDMDEMTKTMAKTKKALRGLLNKITPTTYDDLMNTQTKDGWFGLYGVIHTLDEEKSKEFCGDVVTIMFEKAVEEPAYCEIYSTICCSQVQSELKINPNLSLFRTKLLQTAQSCFKEDKTSDAQLVEMKTALETVTDAREKKQLQDAYEEKRVRTRKKMFGNIEFIGELYKQNLVVITIVHHCFTELFIKKMPLVVGKQEQAMEEEALECAIKLLKRTALKINNDKAVNDPRQPLTPAQRLQFFSNTIRKEKPMQKPRIRFAIENLESLARANWIEKKTGGPKKMDEVRREVNNEHLASKINAAAPRHMAPPARGSYGGLNQQQGGRPQPQRPTQVASVHNRVDNQRTANIAASGGMSSMLGTNRGMARGATGGRPTSYFGRSSDTGSSAGGSREASATRATDDRANALNAARANNTTWEGRSATRNTPVDRAARDSMPPNASAPSLNKLEAASSEEKASTSSDVPDDKTIRAAGAGWVKALAVNWSESDEALNERSVEEALDFTAGETTWLTERITHALASFTAMKSDERLICTTVFGRLLARFMQRGDEYVRHALDGLKAFVDLAEEEGLAEDFPRLYEYVGRVIGLALLHSRLGVPNVAMLEEFWNADPFTTCKAMRFMLRTLASNEPPVVRVSSSDDAYSAADASDRFSAVWRHNATGKETLADVCADFAGKLIDKVFTEDDAALTGALKVTALEGASCQSGDAHGHMDKCLLQMEREVTTALRAGDVAELLTTLPVMFAECSAEPSLYDEEVIRRLAKTVFKTCFPESHADDSTFTANGLEMFARAKELLVRFATGNDVCMVALLDTLGQLVKEVHYPKDLMYGLVDMLTSADREIVTVASFETWFADAQRCPAMMMNDGRLKQLLIDLRDSDDEEDDDEEEEDDEESEHDSPPPLK